ncbi:hypothetical protein HK096_009727 [Nowakowskiella sp. JEL0078]|nr:hypothetical protein HK096_009727 [Nowakowskiella sp. JEL0078]
MLTSKLPLVQSLGIDNFFVKKKSTTKHPLTLKEICKGLKKENELIKERMNYYDETFAMLLEKSHSGSLNSAPTSNPVIRKHATSMSSSTIKQQALIALGSSDSPGRPNATKPKPPLLKKDVMIEAKIQVFNALKKDGKKTWGLVSKFACEFHVCLLTISHWVKRYSNTPVAMSAKVMQNQTCLRFGKFILLKCILIEWMKWIRCRSKPVSISANAIKKKALKIFA